MVPFSTIGVLPTFNLGMRLLRMNEYKQPLLETIFFISLPLLGYYIGEIASLSGIVTVSICGIHLDMYEPHHPKPLPLVL